MINLIHLRQKNNLTQEKLCEKMQEFNCFMTRSTYSKYETGKNEMPYDVLIAFALFFNTTTDYILGLTDKENCIFAAGASPRPTLHNKS